MKRTLLLVAFASLISSVAFSQTDKGWRSVGGTGNLTLDFKNHVQSFNLSPELYWFVHDKIALGVDFGMGFFATRPDDSTSASNVSGFATGGFRYYFSDTEHKWRPYMFLNAGYEFYAAHTKFSGVTSNTNGNGFRGYAGAGLAWFFNEHAAFDMRVHIIDYGLNNSISPPESDIMFNPSFSIGIQAFFD